MPITPIDLHTSYASENKRALSLRLDADHAALEAWLNITLTGTLAAVIRDDDTLVDEVVRTRNLHPEVLALMAGGTAVDLSEIEDRLDALEYVAPDISGLSNSVGTVEIGSTVASVNLIWSVNKTVTSETVSAPGPGSIDPTLRAYNVTGLSLTADQSFTVTVGDGTNTDAATTTVAFQHRRRWGTSATATPDSALIDALAGAEFATSRAQSRSMSPAAAYLYFAWPSSFGTPTFTVNGLPVTGWVKTTISYTNPSGNTTNFDVYRSEFALTGTFSVVVS